MNQKNQDLRMKIIEAIRLFFRLHKFREIETPLLVTVTGTEPYIDLFETSLVVSNHGTYRAFLTTSPELNMKKLLAQGFGDCFQLCKSFRNGEGLSSKHNQEFTILEWYRTQADYTDSMKDCEQLLRFILYYVCEVKDPLAISARQLWSDFFSFDRTIILTFKGEEIELPVSFEKITVLDAFEKYAGMSRTEVLNFDEIKSVSQKKGYSISENDTWETLYNQIFLNEVEPKLGQVTPTFLYEYPASQAALSVRKKDDPELAERFELYWAGMELGNAFTELTDPVEQRLRMEADLKEQIQMGKNPTSLDEEFLNSLAQMPATGGVAVGVDRLVMLFADTDSIQDVIHFPISGMV